MQAWHAGRTGVSCVMCVADDRRAGLWRGRAHAAPSVRAPVKSRREEGGWTRVGGGPAMCGRNGQRVGTRAVGKKTCPCKWREDCFCK
eukprot:jgi/Mesvir1/7449/Mv25808-RA.1